MGVVVALNLSFSFVRTVAPGGRVRLFLPNVQACSSQDPAPLLSSDGIWSLDEIQSDEEGATLLFAPIMEATTASGLEVGRSAGLRIIRELGIPEEGPKLSMIDIAYGAPLAPTCLGGACAPLKRKNKRSLFVGIGALNASLAYTRPCCAFDRDAAPPAPGSDARRAQFTYSSPLVEGDVLEARLGALLH